MAACTMNSSRRAGRRSHSPGSASRFNPFRSLRSSLSMTSHTARSLTDVTVATTASPANHDHSYAPSPEIPEDCSTTDAPAYQYYHGRPGQGVTTRNTNAHGAAGRDGMELTFRPRSTTISDTSPTTYMSLQRGIKARLHSLRQEQHASAKHASVSVHLPDYLNAEELPGDVLHTTVEELRQCHNYIRHTEMRTLDRRMSGRPAAASSSTTSTSGQDNTSKNSQATICGGSFSGDVDRSKVTPRHTAASSDDVVLAASSDGVFAEDGPTPIPSPDLVHMVQSTPLAPKRNYSHSSNNEDCVGAPSTPDVNLFEHDIALVSDRCGYGLVLSGMGPTYVLRVEALGPAYRAGLHVGDFILNANGIDVLSCNHEEISQIIMKNTSEARLVVLSRNQFVRTVGPTIFNHPLGYTQLNQCRLSDSMLVGSGLDSAVSIITEESCLLSDSLVRPRQLSFSGSSSDGIRIADGHHGHDMPIATATLNTRGRNLLKQRRQSEASLLSQSAPVSPAHRSEKPTLLQLGGQKHS
ncbi:uncharacterized protein LOC135805721 [Sycon ciliatum]|uniref:uncharacterized protein LOC135805721 n=1 Tax=Sycon ciliatum TaxID=27933 RepID=UPI0031F699D3|eukprot:scpid42828/ scgid27078/ 